MKQSIFSLINISTQKIIGKRFTIQKLVALIKSNSIFWKESNNLKMAQLTNWKYYVDTKSTHGMISFVLTKPQNVEEFTHLGRVLDNKCKYMKLILPQQQNHTCKHPDFAVNYTNLQKKLKETGYQAMWPLHAVDISDANQNPSPQQHTHGRKRKRVPTFTLGDNEKIVPEVESESHHQMGILLAVPQNNADVRVEIGEILNLHKFKVHVDIECTNGQDSWVCSEGMSQLYVTDRQKKGGDEPFIHPAFIHSSGNHVFHSIEEMGSVLEKCHNLPNLQGIDDLKKYYEQLKELPEDTKLNKPFIVIEGLDGIGKSTLVENVASKLGATKLQSPPKCLQAIRSTYDTSPELIRRLYYSIGNYLVANDIVKECETKPVIMDRFWHSTAAYTIATECSGDQSSLPPPNHGVYDWPRGLLQPQLVILLTASEEVRAQRIGGRVNSTGQKKTDEENKLDGEVNFRQRILDTYRRMRNPHVIEVSADGTKEEVLDTVIKELQKNGINC